MFFFRKPPGLIRRQDLIVFFVCTNGSMLYPQKISDALVIDHYDRKKPHTLGIMVFGFWFVTPLHS